MGSSRKITDGFVISSTAMPGGCVCVCVCGVGRVRVESRGGLVQEDHGRVRDQLHRDACTQGFMPSSPPKALLLSGSYSSCFSFFFFLLLLSRLELSDTNVLSTNTSQYQHVSCARCNEGTILFHDVYQAGKHTVDCWSGRRVYRQSNQPRKLAYQDSLAGIGRGLGSQPVRLRSPPDTPPGSPA